jgi:hypothetical protein
MLRVMEKHLREQTSETWKFTNATHYEADINKHAITSVTAITDVQL